MLRYFNYLCKMFAEQLRASGACCQRGARGAGEKYIFTIEEGANGANGRISVNYDGFVEDVSVGDTLLIDGGIMSLKLLAIEGKDVTCQVVDGGVMKSRCAPGPPCLTLNPSLLPAVEGKDARSWTAASQGHGARSP